MNMEVLLVEDDELVLFSTEQTLKGHGFKVATASSGSKALEVLKSRPIDVMVTDLVIPGINGLELLKKAKALNKDISVILYTAYGNTQVVVDAMRAGVDDFFTKPFQPEELLHRLQKEKEKKALKAELMKARNRMIKRQGQRSNRDVAAHLSSIMEKTRLLLERDDLDASVKSNIEGIVQEAKKIGTILK